MDLRHGIQDESSEMENFVVCNVHSNGRIMEAYDLIVLVNYPIHCSIWKLPQDLRGITSDQVSFFLVETNSVAHSRDLTLFWPDMVESAGEILGA